MKNILISLFALLICSYSSAQNRGNEFKFGKEAAASIRLIDTELIVAEDKTNSIVRFEITNNSSFPIYIARPELTNGTVPQYFDLVNESIECISEDKEMIVRTNSDFTIVSANSSKQFELDENFYHRSCISNDKPSKAILVYRAFSSKVEDSFIAQEYMRRDRSSRDIVEYILTTKLKSYPIKITYEN